MDNTLLRLKDKLGELQLSLILSESENEKLKEQIALLVKENEQLKNEKEGGSLNE